MQAIWNYKKKQRERRRVKKKGIKVEDRQCALFIFEKKEVQAKSDGHYRQ